MPIVIADRVKVTTTTTGTGTLTLGAAATGFQDFGVIGDGNETYYTISVPGGADFEVGIGTFTASGTTLSRDTILDSSNGGLVVNLSAGTKDVFVTYPSGRSVYVAGSTIVAENSAVLPIASGGTGETTASNAINALLPSQTGNSGEYLTTNGSVASWDAVPSPNNGTLTMGVSGTGLSGSASFTADQAGGSTFTVTSNATNANTANTIVARDGSGNFSAGTITAALSGNATTSSSTTGNAATATALQNARTIGGVSFNGTANINLPGVNTAGNQNTTGSAATLTTARTIGGVSFNGSANINLPGVNTAGNQNTTGSAASLTTARAINGTNFNGTANITTANWGTARTINGSSVNGSANVTTANWGTTRTLSIGGTGKSVNGGGNVTWTSAEITAGKLSTASGSAPSYSARAWVNFNGQSTVSIRASGNVSSITDLGLSNYRVNFSTAMPDANYSALVTTSAAATALSRGSGIVNLLSFNSYSLTSSKFDYAVENRLGSQDSDTLINCAVVFR